jgi:hypothetical protein
MMLENYLINGINLLHFSVKAALQPRLPLPDAQPIAAGKPLPQFGPSPKTLKDSYGAEDLFYRKWIYSQQFDGGESTRTFEF